MAARRLDGALGRRPRTHAAGPNLAQCRLVAARPLDTFRFHIRSTWPAAKDWTDRGFTETLDDFADAQRALEVLGRRPACRVQELGGCPRRAEQGRRRRQGIAEPMQLRELLRRVIMKVMMENKLDVLVQLHTPLPPGKIGLAP